MKPLMIIGILLVLAGAYLFYQGGSFSTRKKVLEVGDVKVTASDEHSVPKWAAGAAVVIGLGLLVAGAQGKGRS